MRQVQRGDRVLHLNHMTIQGRGTDSFLTGISTVEKAAILTDVEPPMAGVWAGRGSYYRVELKDYSGFAQPLALSILIQNYGGELRKEIVESRPRNYPLATYGPTLRVVQGMYLARATQNFLEVVSEALGIEVASPAAVGAPHEEFSEGQRKSRETYFFSRNPAVARKAKDRYGFACQVCGFDFGARYGRLGEHYIECHHLNPLSERSESEWDIGVRTSVDDVTVLCANCHRMIHRKKPALSLDDLRAALK